ncbi:glycerophosphodiester phosphodiesterase [Thermosulfidibacter takaii]|nr:glycerophosphodiester phosphodiesterase [Thermosulfidibacter takaii]
MAKIIAHRGFSQLFEENTKEAFEKALHHGAEALETDLQVTKDGIVVLSHGYLLENYPICELSHRQVKTLKPNILALTEFLDLFLNNETQLLLEIKDPQTVSPLINTLLLYPCNLVKNNVIIGSFNGPILQILKEAFPTVRTSLQFGTVFEINDMIQLAKKYSCHFVHPCWEARSPYPEQLINHDDVETVKREGLEMIIWQEDRPQALEVMLRLPAYGICTNNPEIFSKIKAKYEKAAFHS